MTPDTLLRLDGVRFGFAGHAPVVDGVDWCLPRGAFHCLLGRSGCGKSTLLRLAAGLLRADAGRITAHGRALAGPVPGTAFVFQQPTLLEWSTALDNVLLPASLKRRLTRDDRERAASLMDSLGLAGLAARRPHALSGGQQSRVAIARALFEQPALLLMDEPFAAVDTLTREGLHDTLLAACRAHDIAVLFVTHDLAEAVYLGERVAVMHDGRIHDDLVVPLPQPRTAAMRDTPDFQAACAQLRHLLEQPA